MPFLAAIPAAVTTGLSLASSAAGLAGTVYGMAKGTPSAPGAPIVDASGGGAPLAPSPGVDLGGGPSFPMQAPPPPPQYQSPDLMASLGQLQQQYG